MTYRPKIKTIDGTLSDLPLESEIAIKLKTQRDIGLSGVKAMPTPFDGSANIIIPITEVPTSLLIGNISAETITGLIDVMYPIGSVKFSKTDVNPAMKLGGVWQKGNVVEPSEWITPPTTPIPLSKTYWDAALGKSIIDMKNKVFRFKKADYEIIQMVASGIRYISPGTESDIFNLQYITPLSTPQIITGIPNFVLPWRVNWDKISVQEDSLYYYLIVFDYFIFYDPSSNTPDILNVPIRYFVNCAARKQSFFEYTEQSFNYEWVRIK